MEWNNRTFKIVQNLPIRSLGGLRKGVFYELYLYIVKILLIGQFVDTKFGWLSLVKESESLNFCEVVHCFMVSWGCFIPFLMIFSLIKKALS